MSDTDDATEQKTWSSGFTLKKTRDGYSWTISVAPQGNDPKQVEAAIDAAVKLDEKLRRIYGGDDVKARLK